MNADTVGCRGGTITLAGGGYFDLENPTPEMVRIEDVAHALSMLCRWTGHCRFFFSVAQHSVLVAEALPPELALAGLLHDAAEAYVGDVSRPLAALLPDLRRVKERVEAAVAARFGVPHPMPPEVKAADVRLLRTEQRDLTSGSGDIWTGMEAVEPMPYRIIPDWAAAYICVRPAQQPRDAKRAFLQAFERYGGR